MRAPGLQGGRTSQDKAHVSCLASCCYWRVGRVPRPGQAPWGGRPVWAPSRRGRRLVDGRRLCAVEAEGAPTRSRAGFVPRGTSIWLGRSPVVCEGDRPGLHGSHQPLSTAAWRLRVLLLLSWRKPRFLQSQKLFLMFASRGFALTRRHRDYVVGESASRILRIHGVSPVPVHTRCWRGLSLPLGQGELTS